ncbi:hypothetical protein [Phaffia rhodozyma]|uniref:RRN6 beta-propeller domain-containing protein n=1 Tax=Phaffia rhodozyma TaxID=264483 RepID=A0A0F7SIJ3_PHARH|nr:hypothetical protein [Phaffia rhodozyma]
MNGWPDTYRPPPFVYQKRRPLPTESHLQSTNDQGGVRLQYGSLGSVRLDVKGYGKKKGLKIRALGQNLEESKLDQLVPPVLAYPPTKSPDIAPSSSSSLSLRKRTEATKRFLENQREPLHIPYSVLHQHLAEVQSEEEDLTSSWDAFEGNKLACSWVKPLRWKKQVGLVLIPTGPVGRELNISPIYWDSRKKEDVYIPCSSPSVSFSTPICQILASPYHFISSDINATSPTIAIRIHSSSYFVSLIMNEDHNPDDTGLAVSTQLLFEVTIAMTGGNRHMDIALSPWEGNRAIIVDSTGAVWEWTGQHKLILRREPLQKITGTDPFFRVTYGPDDNIVYLMSDQQIYVLNLAHPSKDMVLYDVIGSTSYLTSFSHRTSREQFESDIICFSTTESISWINRRVPKRALLAWEHFRAFDRTLLVWEVDSGLAPTTIISSQSTNLMTAYTVSPNTTPIESLTDPYILPHISSHDFLSPRQGLAFFHHSSLPVERQAEVTMFELGSDLSVWIRRLASREAGIEVLNNRSPHKIPGLRWLSIFQEWAENIKSEEKKISCLDEREKKVVDMRGLFEDLFKVPSSESSADMRGQQAVEGIARMEQFFINLITPLPGIVTSRDIAMMTHDSRPTSQTLNNPAFRAIHPSPDLLKSTIRQLRSSTLSKSSPFQASMNTRVNELIGRGHGEPRMAFENLEKIADGLRDSYAIRSISSASRSSSPSSSTDDNDETKEHLVTSSSASRQSFEKKIFASYACDVLAYDLTLSSSVYASVPINPPVDVDPEDDLERATQAMSLGHDHPIGADINVMEDEIPRLQFTFLRPKPQYPISSRSEPNRTSSTTSSSKVKLNSTPIPNTDQLNSQTALPAGSKTARMLMSSWIIGEDPSEYVHTDLKRQNNLDLGLSSNLDRRAPASSQAAIAARLYGEGTQKMYTGSSHPYQIQTQPYQTQNQSQSQFLTQTPVFGSTQSVKPNVLAKMAPPLLSTVPTFAVTPASTTSTGSGFTQSPIFIPKSTSSIAKNNLTSLPSSQPFPQSQSNSLPYSQPQTHIQTQKQQSQFESQLQSQPQDSNETTLANTQIVRGPHASGGRPYPGLGKTKTGGTGTGGSKTKKKRMGGF